MVEVQASLSPEEISAKEKIEEEVDQDLSEGLY